MSTTVEPIVMPLHDVETWQDVADAILKMTPEQRAMPVQCCNPTSCHDDVQEMVQGICIGTVSAFEFQACRSTHNNKYCPDDVVLLMDVNQHAPDGAIMYEWKDDGSEVPMYGSDGPTKPEDQQATERRPDISGHCAATVRRRVAGLEA